MATISHVTKELLFVYILEGLSIGLLVSSINTIGSVIGDRVDDEKTKTKRTFQWILTLILALSSHVLAESLRHDRILGLLKNVSSKFSFKRPSIGTSPNTPLGKFRRRSILQPIIRKSADI